MEEEILNNLEDTVSQLLRLASASPKLPSASRRSNCDVTDRRRAVVRALGLAGLIQLILMLDMQSASHRV